MPVYQPWSLDVDTIVGVAITLLAMLAVQVATRRCERRQDSVALPSRWRPTGPGGLVPGVRCRRKSVARSGRGTPLQKARVVVPYRVAQAGLSRVTGVETARLQALHMLPALLVAGILAVGCRGNPDGLPAQPAPLAPVVFGTTDRPTDPFNLNTAAVAGAVLTIEVSYSGGCRVHEFVLIVSDSFPESPPDELEMVLTHEDNDDSCEAYPSEQLRFDLTPIRERYRERYDQDSGSVLLRLDPAPSTGESLVYQF